MLVYGDHQESADPRELRRALNREVAAVAGLPAGLHRHARLVGALTEAGRLLQGIADASLAEMKQDRRTEAIDEVTAFLAELGRSVCRSWDSGFAEVGEVPPLLLTRDVPDQVTLKVPEGFAFYAVYSEAYIEAARRLVLSAPPRLIGIRSIGTSLAAVAAAALGAPDPVTVRPFGDPFDRQIAIAPGLERELLDGEAHYIIVDEGPGLSGSSFAAVAEWLLERGIAPERIAVLPSHGGAPGAAVTPARRDWWSTVQRQVGDFGDRWSPLLQRWCAASLGRLDCHLHELSPGSWRNLHYGSEKDWPAVVAPWERRKFIGGIPGDRLLVKFAGLGGIGEEKLRIARALHSEGLVPQPLTLVHGFLVERWCDDGAPLASDDRPMREVARYIGTRAKFLPAASGSGASVEELLKMARRNISVEFGDDAASLRRWKGRAGELERRIVRVRTDNKMDRHEWLRTVSGRLIKTDALDHHQAHDLVGCQDAAWDVAGAIIEFDLDQIERACFVDLVAQESGRRIDRDLLDFYALAYCAFRLGQARLGATMVADPAERRRIGSAGDRYAARLQDLLPRASAATRRKSLVD